MPSQSPHTTVGISSAVYKRSVRGLRVEGRVLSVRFRYQTADFCRAPPHQVGHYAIGFHETSFRLQPTGHPCTWLFLRQDIRRPQLSQYSLLPNVHHGVTFFGIGIDHHLRLDISGEHPTSDLAQGTAR